MLAGDKFLPEMHSTQPRSAASTTGITYSAQAFFQHDMAYSDFNVYLPELRLIKNCVIKCLVLLKAQNKMDTKSILLK